jgi:hypothetical protein
MHLENFYQSIPGSGTAKIPPVESWSPPLSGDIDIKIDNRGRWFHQGDLIKRQALVNTFASILKREADDYYLVTPVEKWRIQVAVAPLLVVSAEVSEAGEANQRITLTTQQGQVFDVGQEHPLSLFPGVDEAIPTVLVRSNLSAIVDRNVFYQLADYAQAGSEQLGAESFGVRSCGAFFLLS